MASTREMREERARLINQAKEISNLAASEGRVMTAEENQNWDRIMNDADALQATYERMERLEDAEKQMSEPTDTRQAVPTYGRPVDTGLVYTPVTNEDRNKAFAAWLMCGSDQEPSDDMLAAANKVGINPRNKNLHVKLPTNPLYQDAIDYSQGKPRIDRQAVDNWQIEYRAQSDTSGPLGQFTIGDEAIRSLEVALLQHGGMRQAGEIIRTNTGAPLPWPTLNDTSQKGEIVGSNSTVNEQDLTFGQSELGAFKYSSKLVRVPVELIQDASTNMPQVVGTALGERIARKLNEDFTVGAGSTEPRGLFLDAPSGVTLASPSAISYDEIVDLEHSVDPAYRANGRWMFHDQTLRELKKIKDADGRPIWQPGLAVRAPDVILGYPYNVNQDVETFASGTTGDKVGAFGDLSAYKIRDVRDITLQRLDERFADLHQVAFLAFSRHDGRLIDAGTNPVKTWTLPS